MSEVSMLLEVATASLVNFEGERLAALHAQSLRLQALGVSSADAGEAMARLRVFAGVLRETERGLRVLERVSHGVDRWAR